MESKNAFGDYLCRFYLEQRSDLCGVALGSSERVRTEGHPLCTARKMTSLKSTIFDRFRLTYNIRYTDLHSINQGRSQVFVSGGAKPKCEGAILTTFKI